MSTPKPYVRERIVGSQRLAKEGTCPRCRTPILTGPDHDRVAHIASVDREPISPLIESQYVGLGLATYDLDRGELCYREPWHRASEFHVSRPPSIHVWHVCR